LVPEVTGDLIPKLLVAYCTRQGTPGLWPIRLPDETGRIDSYNESALAIVAEQSGRWIRVISNQQSRSYEVLESPRTELPAPKWPDGGFNELFSIAFKERVIRSLDHPFLKHLRGEM
jgi:hypothetical protein